MSWLLSPYEAHCLRRTVLPYICISPSLCAGTPYVTCTLVHNWFDDGTLANMPYPLPCTSLTSTFGARCFVSPSMSCSCSFFPPSRKMYVVTVNKAIQTWLLATLTSSIIDRVSLVFSSEEVLLPVGYVAWWADVVSLPTCSYQMLSQLGAPCIKRIVLLFCQTFKDRGFPNDQ